MTKAFVKIKKIFEFEGVIEGESDEMITQKAEDIPFDKFKEKKSEIKLNFDAKKISQFEKREKLMKDTQEVIKQIKKNFV
jgi:hypothetical protein